MWFQGIIIIIIIMITIIIIIIITKDGKLGSCKQSQTVLKRKKIIYFEFFRLIKKHQHLIFITMIYFV